MPQPGGDRVKVSTLVSLQSPRACCTWWKWEASSAQIRYDLLDKQQSSGVSGGNFFIWKTANVFLSKVTYFPLSFLIPHTILHPPHTTFIVPCSVLQMVQTKVEADGGGTSPLLSLVLQAGHSFRWAYGSDVRIKDGQRRVRDRPKVPSQNQPNIAGVSSQMTLWETCPASLDPHPVTPFSSILQNQNMGGYLLNTLGLSPTLIKR